MSSSGQFFTLVTLSDRVVPGFAGIMRASMMSGESRRWSFVNANVEPVPPSQVPQLGTPYQSRGGLTAWVVE
jgi:hypothetical protein